jgi:HEAT repeat protein
MGFFKGGKDVAGLIAQAGSKPSGDDYMAFEQSLIKKFLKIGAPAVDPLISALALDTDYSIDQRFIIAKTLCIMADERMGLDLDGDGRIRDALIAALDDKEGSVRDVVAANIGGCADLAVLKPLVKTALTHRDKHTAAFARESALEFIAWLDRVRPESYEDLAPALREVQKVCRKSPDDEISRAVDDLAAKWTTSRPS